MKPFDLEAAKRGEPICTRDGKPAKFIAHVPEAPSDERVVALLSTGGICLFTAAGGWFAEARPDQHDLFMAPKTRIVWVNMYEGDRCAYWHDDEAEANIQKDQTRRRIGNRAWPMEIEE